MVESRPFEEARSFVHTLELKDLHQWLAYSRGDMPEKGTKPPDIPDRPDYAYKGKGWISWQDWVGISYSDSLGNRGQEDFVQTPRGIQALGNHHGESLLDKLRRRRNLIQLTLKQPDDRKKSR